MSASWEFFEDGLYNLLSLQSRGEGSIEPFISAFSLGCVSSVKIDLVLIRSNFRYKPLDTMGVPAIEINIMCWTFLFLTSGCNRLDKAEPRARYGNVVVSYYHGRGWPAAHESFVSTCLINSGQALSDIGDSHAATQSPT
jgi:hypothetical protein